MVSVLLGEPERARIIDALSANRGLVVSAASLLEASRVMISRQR
ncbi:MAG: type II toxin-antitoxin system VapC family toxin [Ilumatobacteraceae bacterium]|nr:type II toxin-antitoxin system VapC family toxin [Ilumatobacteraceae bacterium]